MRRTLIPKRRADCDHPLTVSIVVAGIERVLCETCGHVSVSHHHDLVVDGIRVETDVVQSGT